jgi:hypothetical protein
MSDPNNMGLRDRMVVGDIVLIHGVLGVWKGSMCIATLPTGRCLRLNTSASIPSSKRVWEVNMTGMKRQATPE